MEVRDLLKHIRLLRADSGEVNPAIWPMLRSLDKYEDLELIGTALARVAPETICAPTVKFKPLRIGMISSFTADAIVPVLRVMLMAQGITPEFYIAGFNQVALELSDPASGLARFKPNVTLCLLDDRFFLPKDWSPVELHLLQQRLIEQAECLGDLIRGFSARQPGIVLINTVPLDIAEWKSVITMKNKGKLSRIWRDLNIHLLELTESSESVYAIDLEILLTEHYGPWRDARLYQYASIAWHYDVFVLIAREAVDVCRALLGLSKKCLVLDLDNTLWGGVIGDDGPSGIQIGEMYPGNCYLALQRIAKRLQQQGVILAVCSKNEASVIKEAFADHPDLLLREEDFAIMEVNWQPKNLNIQNIAQELNLGEDSLVFVDDSPFECELVEANLPNVTVINLRDDPGYYVEQLLHKGSFLTLAVTESDLNRTELYRTRAKRQEFARSFDSMEAYLSQLAIQVNIFTADSYSLPRITQLNLRTNQFNMTTPRYSEAQMKEMFEAMDMWLVGFESSDRFGHEGIVGGVWVKKYPDHWKLENFIMSCRVFFRQIEFAVLQHVIDQAVRSGITRMEAEYRPTAKNIVVKDFYKSAGFDLIYEDDQLIRYELVLERHESVAPQWIQLQIKGGELVHA